jgi:iron complex outermembrane receptor protein
MGKRFFSGGIAVSALILAMCAAPAAAQETKPVAQEAGDSVEDIVVTAQRRSENLQTTPISITALTAATLDKRGVTDVSAIGSVTPNVATSSGGAGSGGSTNLQLYIRGIGQYDFLASTDPGVGLYVDGVYYARAMGSIFDLLDVERVEVLRGPQGTLFGKNALGGAIQVVTTRPKHEFGATVEALYGSFNRLNLRGSINLPISDRIAGRIAFSSKSSDPYGTRLSFATGQKVDRNMGDQNEFTMRATLDVQATDNLDVLLAYDRTRTREQSPPVKLAFVDMSQGAVALWNALVGGPAGAPWDNRYVTSDPFSTYATGRSNSDLDASGGAATITWKGSWAELKSITAYRSMTTAFGVDQDGSPLDYASTYNQDKQHQFSEELQLGGTAFDDRLKWLVGGFYFKERTRDFNQARLVTGLYPALEGLPGPLDGSPLANPTAPGGPGNPLNLGLDLNLDLDTIYRTTSYAGFSQATFNLTDRLSVTGGIRYTHERKEFDVTVRRTQSNTYVLPPGSTVGSAYNDVSPRASIDYKVTQNLFTYFTYSKGFKAGGFDGRPTSAAEGLHSFKPEKLTSYELGIKAVLWDHRIRLNADVYHSDYRDIQLRTNTVSQGTLVVATDNAGQARINGFEAELTVIPLKGLELNGSAGLTDFKYTELGNVPGLTLDSKPLKTPRWTAYGSAQYTIDTGVGPLTLLGDWSFRTRVYQDAANTAILSQPAYSLFNARVTFAPNAHWSLSAFLNNIADKRAITDGFTVEALGFYDTSYIRPREWGVSARYKF